MCAKKFVVVILYCDHDNFCRAQLFHHKNNGKTASAASENNYFFILNRHPKLFNHFFKPCGIGVIAVQIAVFCADDCVNTADFFRHGRKRCAKFHHILFVRNGYVYSVKFFVVKKILQAAGFNFKKRVRIPPKRRVNGGRITVRKFFAKQSAVHF
jgi:hypothetical protein